MSETIKEALDRLEQSLPTELSVGGLLARNNTAHKWRVTFSIIRHRELAFWRFHALLKQTYKLHEENMVLGARILLRSAIETLCVFIYLSEKMSDVIEGKEEFKNLQEETARLLLGRWDEDADPSIPRPMRIGKIVKRVGIKYEFFNLAYNVLSDSVHPNWEGLSRAYSELNIDAYSTTFGDFWEKKIGSDQHLGGIEDCIRIFEEEYNSWPSKYEAFEKWLVDNDATLEEDYQKSKSGDLLADKM